MSEQSFLVTKDGDTTITFRAADLHRLLADKRAAGQAAYARFVVRMLGRGTAMVVCEEPPIREVLAQHEGVDLEFYEDGEGHIWQL